MPKLHVKDGSTWKEAKKLHVKENGSWKNINKMHVKDGGTWKQVFPPAVVNPITSVTVPATRSGWAGDGGNDDVYLVGTATITPTITGGSAPYSYSWQNTSSSSLITNSSTSGSSLTLTHQSWVSYGDTEFASEKWKVTVSDGNGSVTSNECTVTITLEHFCFSTDTPILMADGSLKAAGDINVGDHVKSFSTPSMIDESIPNWEDWQSTNINDGAISHSQVTNADHFTSDHYYLINNEIKVTAKHPFLVRRQGIWQWINADDLQNGDKLLNEDEQTVAINSVIRIDEEIDVVRINVENVDTFFGGSLNGKAILSHNK